ncbi:DCC1-like thiol-disulfide oxidoreductase family protein [Yoonia sp. BS5-3]|uniref:Thiol-disulfide oxidoreductase DCC family protein n=1 Tax=Yoonia phaeophyticola TaxID=3137369 RepID=A0ABZ2VBE0_9RHOB
MKPGSDYPVAVMDGTCALCCWGARMLHRMDKGGAIRIAAIQSDTGAALMLAHGLDPLGPESWLFIENDHVWRDFDAVIAVGSRSGGLGRVCLLLRCIPRALRNWLCARVARNRYRLFGRADFCTVPDAAFQARLLP